MALEDAKLFKQDMYALIIDFTSAFNTTDHDRMLWIMYDLGFPMDAIEVVGNLYQNATTQVSLPQGGRTDQIPVKRGTIQGDTLSPFLFLLYMEPLFGWLQGGGRGYSHACLKETSIENLARHNISDTDEISNGSCADNLLCITQRLCDLHIQADKLSNYADWAALQVSGKKTKVTGILHKAKQTGIYGTDPSQHLKTQLNEEISVQGQHARFIRDTDPFKY